MDNDDVKMVEAKIELERISELQKYKEEFDKLGSNDWGIKDFLSIIAPLGLLLIANSLFTIEPELFQIMSVIFIASSFVQSIVTAERKKTNRRIDLLLKIIKQDQSKNT
ncbi:hypothetical protein CXF85_08720 [Colwellia sp. 75C3]|uniref:hypothetical protein n=1 Tax=Colwellia sp. 75C3 TaxID=888425 RepID=UPI000C343594|nr:hypothetical protein [Colwellia sp. 75C3]PKG84276.1 hypothetical protein CXF85_08720 [Colwellia sp. 75C3]